MHVTPNPIHVPREQVPHTSPIFLEPDASLHARTRPYLTHRDTHTHLPDGSMWTCGMATARKNAATKLPATVPILRTCATLRRDSIRFFSYWCAD